VPAFAGTEIEKSPSAVVVPSATAAPAGWPNMSISNSCSLAPEIIVVLVGTLVGVLVGAEGKPPSGGAVADAAESPLPPPPQAVRIRAHAVAIAVFQKPETLLLQFTLIISNLSLNLLLQVIWTTSP